MRAHRLLGPRRIGGRECRNNGGVLVERLFGHTRMEHESKDVEMRVLEGERLANEVVLCAAHDLIVKDSISPREVRIPGALVVVVPARHDSCRVSQFRESRIVHQSCGFGGGLRF